jgi:hypothetical protein
MRMSVDKEKTVDHINKSGFPLQIVIAHVIDETVRDHGWRVQYKEHAWTNDLDETNGFVDLVIRNRYDTYAMVVECKRVLEASWTFLLDSDKHKSRAHVKAWVNHYVNNEFRYSGWADIAADPLSPEALFCVVQEQRDRPMLECLSA